MSRPEELLDDLADEVEGLATQMAPEELALRLQHRAQALPVGAPCRAALLSHAGERWELAGELARARGCYEEAIADGGACLLDPRGQLANVLYDLGEVTPADELVAELERDARRGRLDHVVHAQVGELLEQHGRLDEALWWFEAGLAQDPEDPDLTCLNGRWRVRRVKRLPLDRMDVTCEAHRQTALAGLGRYRDDSPSAGGVSPVLAVVYWPEPELARVLESWPYLAADYGEDHTEHRRLVESRLRQLADAHGRVTIASARFSDYVSFAAERDHAAGESSTRAMYAAHLAHLGHTRPWPPARDQPCWCGSGRPYSSCCGAPGFAMP